MDGARFDVSVPYGIERACARLQQAHYPYAAFMAEWPTAGVRPA